MGDSEKGRGRSMGNRASRRLRDCRVSRLMGKTRETLLLWAGPGAALSHLTAAAILGLREGHPQRVDVTTTRRLRIKGVSVHRSSLCDAEVTRIGYFVVTSALRTLVDLASVLDAGRLEDCFEEALFQSLVDLSASQTRVDGGVRGNKGAPKLRRLVETWDPPWKPTASSFESLLFRTLRAARLPLPERQVCVRNGTSIVTRLDFAYPRDLLAVPADSYRFHGNRRGWENDVRVRNILVTKGWRIRPTTWTELKRNPNGFTTDIAVLLADNGLLEKRGRKPS
jgi:hypothetical protein